MKARTIAWIAASIGVGLSAAFTARAEQKAPVDNPPDGMFVETGGVKLHYSDKGAGDVVVLLHGNGVSHADFNASGLIEQLAKTNRVIAFDRPGYGHSTRPANRDWSPAEQADLLFAALRHIGVERAVIVGHSMGAVIALSMALSEPQRVNRLVLISGYYYPTRRLDAALAAPLGWPYIGTAMLYGGISMTARLLLNQVVKGMFAPNKVPAVFFAHVRPELMVRPIQIRASAQDADHLRHAALEMEGKYGTLTMPVTIIAGASDPVVSPDDHSVRLHGDVIHSALLLKPDVGHMVHHFALIDVANVITTP